MATNKRVDNGPHDGVDRDAPIRPTETAQESDLLERAALDPRSGLTAFWTTVEYGTWLQATDLNIQVTAPGSADMDAFRALVTAVLTWPDANHVAESTHGEQRHHSSAASFRADTEAANAQTDADDAAAPTGNAANHAESFIFEADSARPHGRLSADADDWADERPIHHTSAGSEPSFGARAATVGIGSAEEHAISGASLRGPDPSGTNSLASQTLTNGHPTGNIYLDALIDGCKWTGGPVLYSFAAGDPNGDLGFNGAAWTSAEKNAFISVLQKYSSVCSLTFAEAATTADAQILWFKGTDAQLGGDLGWHDFPDGTYPNLYGVFNSDASYWNSNTLQPGGDAYDTILHEIGHGLGLAHPHDGGTQGDATIFPGATEFGTGTNGLNQSIWTVMSYNSGWDAQPANSLNYGQPLTPMAFDIAALQQLYSANMTFHTGVDVYSLPMANASGTGWSCIWDAGGADTISAIGTAGSVTIDLRAAPLTGANAGGYVSWVSGIAGGFTIANGVTIENAIGGGGQDSLTGNDADNTLTGGAGKDTLTGGGGMDTFVFATGDTSGVLAQRDIITDFAIGVDKIDLAGIDANTLLAGQEAFRFNGWAGFDGAGSLRLTYNNAGLTTIEGDTNGDGVADFGIGLKAASWLDPTSADFTAASLALPVNLTGDGNANTLTGGNMNDTLTGNGGDDILDGRGGADQMTGGTGNDTYYADNAGDVVTELSGEGTADLVRSRISYTLGANVENLTLETGAGNLSGTGNSLANVITGNEGANTLTGAGGADTLTGGAGADTFVFATGDTGATAGTRDLITDFQVGVDKLDLSGIDANTLAAGQDAFRFLGKAAFDGAAGALHTVFDSGNNQTIIEGDTNGDGTADFQIALSGNLTLGTGDFTSASLLLPMTLTGDGNANTLTGGAMNDTLTGNGGDDTLDGGKGADQMTGGSGNDTYSVDNAGDAVTELANEGIDLIRAKINYTLGANVENLTLETGAGNLSATGNALNNTIIGNEGNNTITGGAGLDTLTGGAGVDTFVFGAGDTSAVRAERDIITDFQVGVDKIDLSGIDANTLVAGQDAFRFNGWAGFDGAGSLRLTYNNAGLTMIEGDTNGDGVADFGIGLKAASWLDPTTADFTASSLALPVTLTGDGNANTLTGGAMNDTLTGNGGDDVLDGRGGADQMTGGTGNDTYYADNVGDVVTEASGEGTADLVRSRMSYTLGANVENLTLETGAGNLSGTGNSLGNTIVGNEGNNTITGAGGKDTLTGGAGVDTFVFAAGDSGATAGTRDVVTDFTVGVDKLDLSSIDANTLAAGQDAFRFLGKAAFDGAAGALHTVFDSANNQTIIEADTNGDGTADFTIALSGNLTLGTGDFTGASLALPVTLTGDANANTLTGGAMNDTLTGNGGDDTLDGGKGADQMTGGTGNDTYSVDNAGDAVTELANEGIDLIRAKINYTLGANVENLTLETGAGNLSATGNALNNTIIGNEGNNTITGGAGLDTLTGGAGVDTFVFGAGDTSAVRAERDIITDFQVGTDKIDLSGIDANTLVAGMDAFRFNGWAGFDGAGSLRLTYNNAGLTMIEGDTNGDGVADFGIGLKAASWLEPTTADFTASSLALPVTLTGDGNANTLSGGAMNDTLTGNGGDDVLDGRGGADQMTGGTGNDTYYADNAGDVVTELSGEGTADLVRAKINYMLGANVENLTLETGAGNLSATGNSLANAILGNEGNNTITGGGGKDTLTGGAGADTFVFAAGDTGATAGTRDLITDFSVGVDKLDLSGIDANTLAAGQDAFRFLGAAALDGAAGALHTVYDSANNQTLLEGDTNGDGTADFAIAFNGNLTLGTKDFTAASLQLPMTLTGDANANTLTGGAMNDTLTGNGGDDILDGGKGADQMTGGTGNDTYFVDNAGDVVTELASEGADLVRSRINYTLGANVENLTLETGAGNLSATGNALNNTIIGNDGSNTITGGAGLDTLTGGAGVDTFVFGAGDTSAVKAERDIITDFEVGVDKIDLAGIDANTLVAGQDAFRFNGWAGFDGAGSLRLTYNNAGLTMIEGDTNGDGVADFGIGLKAASWLEPTTADFTASSLVLPLTLTGDSGPNTLLGGAVSDTLTGNGGDDVLDGRGGADQMTGGTGNDTYYADNAGDVVTEQSGEGTADLVRSRISYTLGANVENLTLETGAGNLNGTGNSLANVLIGNEGNNTLVGDGGNDKLDGGAGNDSLDGGIGDDTAEFHGKFSDYQITYTAGGMYVADLNGADGNDGIDWLYNTEHAKFADYTIDIQPQSILKGVAAGDNAGTSVAGIGDINKDGFDDFLVGAPGAAGKGAAYVVFGSASGLPASLDLSSLDGTDGFKLSGIAAGDRMGFAVAGAGDVNKDGYADFIIGALGADAPYADTGATYVVFGHGGAFGPTFDLSTLNGKNGFQVNGEATGDLFGGAVAGAGDFNGDGYADLIIGADAAGSTNAGAATIIYGDSATFPTNHPAYYTDYLVLPGAQAYDHAGWSVSSAGDFNGDGIDDVIVGSILAGTSGAYNGAAYVVFGQAHLHGGLNLASINGTNGVKLTGITQYELAGFSVSSAGDFNGDGFDDVIVSAPYADVSGVDSGRIYVVFGHGGAFPMEFQLGQLNGTNGFRINGLATADYAGWSVSKAGDVNGDGLDDLIIGVPNADANDNGAAYVLFGQSDPMGATFDLSKLDTKHGFRIGGDFAGDLAGISVSAAGDINGDGFDDLLVGAAGADPNGASSGAVEVIFGSRSDIHAIGGSDKADILTGTQDADTIRGLDGDDTLNGLGGDDLLYGGKGADKMVGGAGNDTYVLDNAGDAVTEAGAGGIDTVKAAGIDIDMTKGSFVGQEIENVTLLGNGNNKVVGNDLNNSIQGNDGDNLLDGAGGNDAMRGSKGNDTYVVDVSGDTVTESADSGTDTVRSAISYTLGTNVENLVLTGAVGTENLSGTGNELNNTIVGNAGANALSGGAGDDTLTGGKGVDTLTGGAGSDIFGFATGDTGAASGARDRITDFQAGIDRLDLSNVDSNSNAPGDSLFRFIGTRAFEEAGDLRFRYDAANNVTLLEGDRDGDKVADFAIEITGNVALTDSSFTNGSVINLARPASVTIVNDDDHSLEYSGIRPTVSAAGDLNNDGYADFVIGLQSSSSPNGSLSGNAYVIYGTRSGVPEGLSLADIDGGNGFKVWGSVKGESLGYGADSAGDFNGDGVSDLLLSAPWYSSDMGLLPTRAYLIYGDAVDDVASPLDLSQLNSADGVRFQGQTQSLGDIGSVSAIGDVNADGIDDIAIGAPNDGSSGRTYVVFGTSGSAPTDLTTLNGKNGFTVLGEYSLSEMGESVSGAGDINGDGINDLVVEQTKDNNIIPTVIFGHSGAFASSITPSTLSGSEGFSITGIKGSNGYYFNQIVSSGGDVNGDGYADLIIGAVGASALGRDLSGAAYVVFGHGGAFNPTIDVSSLNGTNGFAIYGAYARQYLGNSVAIVGDVNGDGYADLLVGAANPYDSGIFSTDPGHAYLIYGSASGFSASLDLSTMSSTKGFVISGHSNGDHTGWSVSGAGDIDGDGLDDLLVASPNANGNGYGEVQIIYGKASAGAIVGTDYGDTLNGTAAANIIIGGHGHDTIYGGGGADSIRGGSGDDQIHVSDRTFFRIDGGGGSDVLHLDFSGAIDFGNIDNNAATSDRGKISGIETIDVDNGSNNAMTLHLADVLDIDANDTNVGGVATLDNVLKIDGNAGDTLNLLTSDGWSGADTGTLAGYAIYTHANVKIAVDTDIAVSVS